MAELEIIDAEIVPHPSYGQGLTNLLSQRQDKDANGAVDSFPALSPVSYTQAEREAALRLLTPSTHEVVLGAGWVDSEDIAPDSRREETEDLDADRFRRASSASSSSSTSISTPSTPPSFSALAQNSNFGGSHSGGLSDALLVRSCSQGWSLSFELTSSQPVPAALQPDQILIRNDAVGLNPVDWKSVSFNFGIPAFPWILGRDIAGTIVTPPTYNPEGWKAGDRVWTCADSREMSAGGYQTCSVHKKGTLARIPERVSDEEAATLGTGLVTAAVAMFAFFKLPFGKTGDEGVTERLETIRFEESKDERDWILIYGGGAVTGIYTAQLAALSHLRVISIASPANFSYLRSIGVTTCIDRHESSSSILSSIRSVISSQGGRLRYAIDCVSSATADLCLQALSENSSPGVPSGELIGLAGNPKAEPGQVKVHRISFSTTFYHADGVFAKGVLDYVTKVLEEGRLQPCRPELLPDGLAGIRYGLELLREGKTPRARKLVVRVKDTPAADVTHLGVRTELGWNGVV